MRISFPDPVASALSFEAYFFFNASRKLNGWSLGRDGLTKEPAVEWRLRPSYK
jgi:hypothetical protein